MEKVVKPSLLFLSQILINLLGNGLKFTNRGNVWLKLKLLKENKDLVSIRFEIIDDGPGIPKSQQKLIFEKRQRFYIKINYFAKRQRFCTKINYFDKRQRFYTKIHYFAKRQPFLHKSQ